MTGMEKHKCKVHGEMLTHCSLCIDDERKKIKRIKKCHVEEIEILQKVISKRNDEITKLKARKR